MSEKRTSVPFDFRGHYGKNPLFEKWGPGDWKILRTYTNEPLSVQSITGLLDTNSPFYGQAICSPDRGALVFSTLTKYMKDLIEASQRDIRPDRDDVQAHLDTLRTGLNGPDRVPDPGDDAPF